MRSLTVTYFHRKYNRLSSAQRRFTVLFGMGRSGTTLLWPSGKGFVSSGRSRTRRNLREGMNVGCEAFFASFLSKPKPQ